MCSWPLFLQDFSTLSGDITGLSVFAVAVTVAGAAGATPRDHAARFRNLVALLLPLLLPLVVMAKALEAVCLSASSTGGQ